MKKQHIIVPAVAIIAAALAVAGSVAASDGGFGKMFGKHDEMQDAIEANDYEAWKTALEEKRNVDTSEEVFNDMREHYAEHEAMQGAIENDDYVTWADKMNQRLDEHMENLTEMESKINEDTFAKVQEMHRLMQDGDRDGAKTIAEEVGFGFGRPRGIGFGKGMGEMHKGGMMR